MELKIRSPQRNHRTSRQRVSRQNIFRQRLKEAIDYFEESSWVKEVLGEEFCDQYITAKKNEWLRYTRQVTDWEIAEYLYRL